MSRKVYQILILFAIILQACGGGKYSPHYCMISNFSSNKNAEKNTQNKHYKVYVYTNKATTINIDSFYMSKRERDTDFKEVGLIRKEEVEKYFYEYEFQSLADVKIFNFKFQEKDFNTCDFSGEVNFSFNNTNILKKFTIDINDLYQNNLPKVK